MTSVAFYATLFNRGVATTGVALRTPDRRVFFQTEAIGTWTELHDADAANLHLHGRVDLALAAAVEDGDLVLKASRTVQRRAA